MSRGFHNDDIRGLLQYVSDYRDRLFLIDLDLEGLSDVVWSDLMLDLLTLHHCGVRMVLITSGDSVSSLVDWAIDFNYKHASEILDIHQDDLSEKIDDVLSRGQSPIVSRHELPVGAADVLPICGRVKPHKYLALLQDFPQSVATPVSYQHTSVGDITSAFKNSDVLETVVSLVDHGILRCHLLDANVQGVMLSELLSNEGAGVMIYADRYHHLRSLERKDIPELLSMIGRCMRNSYLVPRTYEDIESKINDYHVLEVDGNVVGCVAVHYYPDENIAEIACLYVKQSHEGRGYGQDLMKYAESVALASEVDAVFAFTTSAAGYFERSEGYSQGGAEQVPKERISVMLDKGRNSKIYIKQMK